MRSKLKKGVTFSPQWDLNCVPMEAKYSVLPMSYTECLQTKWLLIFFSYFLQTVWQIAVTANVVLTTPVRRASCVCTWPTPSRSCCGNPLQQSLPRFSKEFNFFLREKKVFKIMQSRMFSMKSKCLRNRLRQLRWPKKMTKFDSVRWPNKEDRKP